MSHILPAEDLSHYVKDVTRRAVMVAFGTAAVTWLCRHGDLSVPAGVVFGSLVGIVRFRLRARNLMAFAATPGQGRRVLMRGRAVSYLLAAAALAVAFAWEGINTPAAVLSLFLVNLVVILTAHEPVQGP